MEQVRLDYGYTDADAFKFHTRSRPTQIDVPTWTESKAMLLLGAAELGVELIVYVVHHGIAAGKTPNERMEFAMNAVISHFDSRYLTDKQDYGVVCVDLLDPQFGYS